MWLTLSAVRLCVDVCVFAKIEISSQSMNGDFVSSAALN